MELKVTASAGTLESSDIQIIIEPSSNGIELNLESTVMAQFGEQIESVIKATLKSLNVENAKIFANDKGAIDPVIKSRVQTAAHRSAQNKEYKYI
ncbi:citrate lyase acyl carrier protein [Paraclostridium dentum]|uniref:citrate lyase acyl carrier protein n=1 Tax=Paraclostridium dentum TaxID=2662455 RepID=UPI00051CCD9B|nr:citrate lyase acyl carrier protein [Paraclostridium dentum]KGJ49995.1 citrate lyase subunit gamma [Clostridium sp. NCR]